MALADILAAIQAEATKQIRRIEEGVANEKVALSKKSDEELAAFEEEIRKQTALRKEQMQRKARTHIEMEQKRILLKEKRKALDEIYTAVITEFNSLPEKKKQSFSESLKNKIKGRNGETREAKEGGFVFISDDTEEDLTVPHLVQTVLRPQTEITVSTELFT